MVDRLFREPSLAELYDAFCVGRRDFDFYLPLVISAASVWTWAAERESC